MRWVTYERAGHVPRTGLLDGETVRGLPEGVTLIGLLGDDGTRLREAGEQARAQPAEIVPLASVRLRSPIPRPPSLRDTLCFLDHLRGCNRALGRAAELPEVWTQVPGFYFANVQSVIGPYDDVAISPGSRWFDFECEVGAVIGRGGRDLHPEHAESHIVGYTLLCDWSARDLQMLDMKLGIGQGKGKDGATTLGPALVTVDELEPSRTNGRLAFELRAKVNDREIARATLDQMDWTFGEVLAYLSRGVDLVPGDVIGSGTIPGGCLLEHVDTVDPGIFAGWLSAGDVVSLFGEGLGSTRQRVLPSPPVQRLRSGY